VDLLNLRGQIQKEGMKKSLFFLLFIFVFSGSIFSCPGAPNFTFPSPWCENTAVTFNNTSTGAGVTQYTWDWGDAGANTVVGTSASQTHTYAAGTYTIKLIRVFSNGCTDSISQNITIVANTIAAPTFSFTPNNGCSNGAVSFTNTTAPSAGLNFSWNFGDPSTGNQNTSNNNNPSHTFSATGNAGFTSYTVTLTSTNSAGCTNNNTGVITVGNRPDAALADSNIFFPFNNCGFASVSSSSYYISLLNNSSTTASNTNYNIDWGDGSADFNSATFTQTNHTYPTLGIYNILLTVTGSNGCVDTTNYSVINLSNPSVGISGPGSTNGCAPQTFLFNVQLDSANLAYTSYNFNFGDGTPIVTWSPPITSTTISHTFNTTSCGQPGNQFTVMVTAKNACDSTTSTVNNIKISAKPVANFTATPNPGCVNVPVTFINQTVAGCFITGSSTNSTSNFVWSWGDGTANTSTTSLANQVHTYTATGTYNVTLTATNPCGNTSFTLPVTIIGPPLADFTNTPPGCAPVIINFTNQSTGSSITYNWTVNSMAGVSFTGATTNTSTNPNIQFSTSGTYTVTLTTTNNCGSSIEDTVMIIKTIPTIALAAIPGGCEPYTTTPSAVFTNGGGTISNYSWTFTGGAPATNNTSTPGAVTWAAAGNYTVNVSATNECGTATANTTFTVNPLPLSNAGADATICIGASVNLGTAATAGYTYSWSSLPAGFSSAASNPSSGPVSTTTFVVNTTLNGCSKTDTAIVIVNPLPVVTAGANQIVCINTAAFNLSGTPVGGSWSGTGITNAATGTFNPATAGAGTFTETYAYTDPATTCSNTSTVQITVDALPLVNAGPDFTECNQPGTITLSGFSPAGGTWSGTAVSAGGVFSPSVAGVGTFPLVYTFTNANGCLNRDTLNATVINSTPAVAGADNVVCLNSAAFNLPGFSPAGGVWTGTGITNASLGTFNPATAGAGTFTLVYSFGTGTCATSDTLQMTVNALPVVAAGASQTMCVDAASFNLAGNSPAGGTWSGTGITNGAAGTFDPATAGAGIFTLTYSFTDPVTNCTNTSTKTITVNALPVVNAGTGTVYCNQPGNINLTGFSPAGGTWTGDGITNSSGIFDPSTAALGNDTLTYTFTNGNGCTNSDTIINVIQAPSVADAGIDDTVCVNDAAFNLAAFTPVGGTWSGAGITNASAGTFNPAVSGAGTFVLTYSYGTGSCNTTDTKTITVNALPVINPGPNDIVCLNSPAFNFSGFSPAGGTWSGTGITNASSGTFDPAVAGSGTFTVTYAFTDPVTNCTNTSTKQVTVNALPVVNAGTGTTLCDQPITYTLTGFTPAGGTWSGTGVSAAGVFDPSAAGVGTFTLTYTFTSGLNCTNTDTIIMTVIAPATANAGVDDTVCVNDAAFNLSGFSPAAGTWSGTGITNSAAGTFDPSVSGSGTFTLTYTYGAGTCLTTDTKTILVNALPALNPGPNEIVCLNDAAYNLSGFSPAGGTWSGTGITNGAAGTFSPATAGAGTFTLTYTFTDPITFCTTTTTKQITVNALPVVDAGNGTTVCDQPITYTLSGFSPAGGTWSGTGVTGAGVFDPSVGGVGTYTLTYTFTSGLNCSVSDTVIMNVIPPAFANAGPNDSICLNGGLLNLAGFSPVGGTWTGTGIVNASGIFDPVTSGVGDFTITYSYGAGTCFTQSTKIVHVDSMPLIVAGPNEITCISTPAYNLTGYSPVGGTWSGTGITNAANGTFSPAVATAGTYTLTYTFTDPQTNCTDFKTKTITVEALPVPAFTHPSPTCINAPVTFTNNSTGATVYSWNFGDGNISASATGTHTYLATGIYTVQLIAATANGCSDSTTSIIELIQPPNAFFTVAPDTGCAPLSVNYSDASTGSYITYNWNFGDGTSSALVNPPAVTYTNGLADTAYIITLDVTNICGVSTHSDTVQVYYPSLTADFGTNFSVNCSPMTIQFNSLTTGLASVFVWDFGDGTTGTGAVPPAHTYFYSGTNDTTYFITMIAYNHCRSDTTVQSITVYPNTVTAFFNSTNTNGCVPHTVTFTDFSSGGTNVSWDFGDGNLSGVQSPSHTFTTAGTYTVSQFVNNGCGFDTATVVVTVYPNAGISFTYAPDPACVGQTVAFTNTSANAGGFNWNFGDGSTSTLVSPSHAYVAGGIYTITLTATSQTFGCVDSIQQVMNVFMPPVAAFTPSPLFGCQPLPVSFTNTSTNSNFYTWTFGDGNTSASANPANTYLNVGTYTVQLLAQNLDGCKDSVSQTINVYPIPATSFIVSPAYGCDVPQNAAFANTTTGAVAYSWNFGNGQTSLNTNPTATYTATGTYTIDLIASNAFGCSDTATTTFVVFPKPVAAFTPLTTSGCNPVTVQFTNLSTNSTSYSWTFTDGTSSSLASPSHTFSGPGVYGATLISTSNGTCSDTFSVASLVTVFPEPVAAFNYNQVVVDETPDGTISFTNLSTNSINYLWSFGDGDTSSAINPVHQYSAVGDYLLTLIASNQFGCIDTISDVVVPDYFEGLFVPNAFIAGSPDPDLKYFLPKGKSLKEYKLMIYDTWGALMWESTLLNADGSPAEGWDGTYLGQPCHQDVYVWKIEARFLDGNLWRGQKFSNGTYNNTGSVHLIR
jgi:large repetitive protein